MSGLPLDVPRHRVDAARAGRRRRILHHLFMCAGALLAAAAWLAVIAWLVGRIMTDRFEWTQWLWWVPTPVMVMVGLLGMTSSLRPARSARCRRQRMIVWLTLELFVVVYFLAFEHRFLSRDVQPSGGVRLVHWNLAHPSQREMPDFAAGLEHLNGDIIVLTSPGTVLREERVREHFSRYPTVRFLGLFSIISKFPMLGARMIQADDRIFITLVELDTAPVLGRPIIVYLIDLPSEVWLPRMEIAKRVRAILDRADAPPPDLVMGDFNIPAGSASVARMFPEMQEAFAAAGHGYGATWPRGKPFYRIDLTLVSDAFEVAHYDVIDPAVGHHRAQATTIRSAE